VIEGQRRAIIDIGSNTIRLVVFGGSPRVPVVLYNEKVMAGLGRAVFSSGKISESAMTIACAGLQRFKVLLGAMDVATLRVVATAAVRDASNGREFLSKVRDIGFAVELLSGEQEANASGHGVISAIPGADGVVADLGGGSLELVRVAEGKVLQRTSLPFGILSVAMMRAQGTGKLRRHVQALIAQIPWAWQCNNLPLYLVGGSWRSLARVHIHMTGFPLSVLGNYTMSASEARPMSDAIQLMDKAALKMIPSMPSGRTALVGDAAALLAALVEAISPSNLVTCAYGLREGLLYEALVPTEQAKDPLIEGVRFATAHLDQFPGHGEALTLWLGRLFAHEPAALSRLRDAAALMVGTGWASNPDFRALSGEELALHGNWSGVDARDRAIIGMALFVGLGGTGETPSLLSQLADEPSLKIARGWGAALRLAQRLSGGAASILHQTIALRQGTELELAIPSALASLCDDSVRRRLGRLAQVTGATESRIIFP
jgi:exopolyphosphatase / guanosine-5'-triphosphate,3'-diphosphate pyrophosphatase